MEDEKQFNIRGDQRITKPNNIIPRSPDTLEKSFCEW